MKLFLKLCLSTVLAGISTLSFSAANPLSVHILDLQTGQPMTGITVTLEKSEGNIWHQLNSAVTNEQGRIAALFPAEQSLVKGNYRVVFKTGERYASLKQPTFFPEIPVQFHVDKTNEHYHIPLLLSPFGFSTYRGN